MTKAAIKDHVGELAADCIRNAEILKTQRRRLLARYEEAGTPGDNEHTAKMLGRLQALADVSVALERLEGAI